MDPVLALRCATYNAAYRLAARRPRLVAAGRRADIVILLRLAGRRRRRTTCSSAAALVASGGRMLVDVVEGPSDPPLDTMQLAPVDADDMLLRLDAPDGAAPHARDRRCRS